MLFSRTLALIAAAALASDSMVDAEGMPFGRFLSRIVPGRGEKKKKDTPLENVLRSLLAQTPTLQTEAGDDFGDGAFEWGDMVTVHGVRNLGEGLSAKVIAYDVDESLYVIRDGTGAVWGVPVEKLAAMQTVSVDSFGSEWTPVPDGARVPAGLEIKMDLQTGETFVRNTGM